MHELIEFLREEFSLKNFLLDRKSNRLDGADRLVSYYRPIKGRGFCQWRCLMAILRTWKKTRMTNSYCHMCNMFLEMTCMESNIGCSRECRKGHYRFEAT